MNTWYLRSSFVLAVRISDLGFTRAMTRNEAKYANPEQFQPERFLSEDGELNNDTVSYAFGAGRRICVGRYIADASLWSAMASILAIFTIMPCKDEQGNDIPVNPQWTAGITSYVMSLIHKAFRLTVSCAHPVSPFFFARHPHHFPCKFVPRAPGGLTAEKLAQIF